jgi:hypothetical protein
MKTRTFTSTKKTSSTLTVEIPWEIFWGRVSTEIACTPTHGKHLLMVVRPALQFYTLASTSKLIQFIRDDPISAWTYPGLGLSHVAVAELSRILEFSTTLQVSDPRDRIYAFLGVLQPLGVEVPDPDYSKCVEEVFLETRAALAEKLCKVGESSAVRGLFVQACHDCVELYNFGGRKQSKFSESKTLASTARHASLERLGNTKLDQAQHRCSMATNDSHKQDNTTFHPPTIPATPESNKGPESGKALLDTPASPAIALGRYVLTDGETDEDSMSETSMSSSSAADVETTYLDFFESFLEYHKQLLVEQVVAQLKSNPLPDALMEYADGGVSSNSASVGERQSCLEQNGNTGRKLGWESGNRERGKCRKRMEDGGEDEDEEEKEQPPKKQPRDRILVDPRDRLACPYFQRNSQGPRLHQSCRGPGFENLARLKYVKVRLNLPKLCLTIIREHLYRNNHVYRCDRCGDVFARRASLTEHLQSLQACERRDCKATFDPAEGFDDEQKANIKKKTIQSWDEIFKILFPEDPKSSYPPHRKFLGGVVAQRSLT